MQTLRPGIVMLDGLKLGRIYGLVGADGLTLIDASAPNSLPQITRDLARGGFALGDVKRILLTHAHWDHYGSLAALTEATGAEVWVPALHESAVVRGELPFQAPQLSSLGWFDRLVLRHWIAPMWKFTIALQVDRELHPGERLDAVWPGLEVVGLPGHTPGQCGFWLPQERVLLGGDVLMAGPLGRMLAPLHSATTDLLAAEQSVRRVVELAPELLGVGHGRPVRARVAAHAQALADRMARARLRSPLAQQP